MLKKTLALSLLALPFMGSAAAPVTNSKAFSHYHQAGLAVQIAGGEADYAYYTDNHEWVFGFGGLNYEKVNSTTDAFHPGIFVRKNMQVIDERTVFGIGTNAYMRTGQKDGVDISSGSYSITPVYFGLEYALSPHFALWMSLKPYTYTKTKFDNGTKETSEKYFKAGSIQLAYIF